MAVTAVKDHASQKRRNAITRFLIYFFLIVITAFMLLPFLWMLSSSFKDLRRTRTSSASPSSGSPPTPGGRTTSTSGPRSRC